MRTMLLVSINTGVRQVLQGESDIWQIFSVHVIKIIRVTINIVQKNKLVNFSLFLLKFLLFQESDACKVEYHHQKRI